MWKDCDVWTEAAKWLARYPDVVVTALDTDGYPVSIRQNGSRYDARTGEFPVDLPDELRPAAGLANLLCHKHDELLWDLSAIHIKGSLDHRDGDWVFTSSAFTPPPRLELWHLAKRMRAAARRYLSKRQLEAPAVNWSAISEIWKEVAARQPK